MSFFASGLIEDIRGFTTIISVNNYSCAIRSSWYISYVAHYPSIFHMCN